MRIAVIGTGKMGWGFASALSGRHEVVFGSRDPAKAGAAVRSTGAAGATSPAAIAAGADVVILAVPWSAMEETLVGPGGARRDRRGRQLGAVRQGAGSPGPSFER